MTPDQQYLAVAKLIEDNAELKSMSSEEIVRYCSRSKEAMRYQQKQRVP